MLYHILKNIARMMLRVYFDEVHFLDAQNIPKDKPLVLAANHQSAFIEPVLLGALMPFEVHFITRGDVFVKKYLWFFDATNQIPIFRFRDGFKSMKRNMDSFERVYAKLRSGARVIIFCEGGMKWEKKLHPLQKGAARMALGALQGDPDLDIHVLPIGINYEEHTRFRRNVKISFAKAIPIKHYSDQAERHDKEKLAEITEELSTRLKPNVIHIASDAHYETADHYLTMARNEFGRDFFKVLIKDKQKFLAERDAALAMDQLDKDGELVEKFKSYASALGSPFKYVDYVLRHPGDFSGIKHLFFYLIILPVGLLGLILNSLPVIVSSSIAHKRAPNPEFYGSLKSVMSVFFYLAYYLIISVILLLLNWQLGLIALFILPLSGLIGVYLWDQWPYFKASMHLGRKGKDQIRQLGLLREELLSRIANT